MSLRSLSKLYCLPGHSQDDLISLPMPSIRAGKQRYKAPMPPYPTTDLTKRGLKETKSYLNRISHKFHRDISPRLLKFIHKIRDNCSAAKNPFSKGSRADLLESITTDRDMLASRWDSIHGEFGLASTLIESIRAMTEVRMRIEYGDYLAMKLAELKKDKVEEKAQGHLFRRSTTNWVEVSEVMKKERTEEELVQNMPIRCGKPMPTVDTPCLDSIRRAASIVNVDPQQLMYEIEAYAARNMICHIGIGRMVEKCS